MVLLGLAAVLTAPKCTRRVRRVMYLTLEEFPATDVAAAGHSPADETLDNDASKSNLLSKLEFDVR